MTVSQPFKWILKLTGITPQILEEALAQAKKARFEILDVIEATIPEVRLTCTILCLNIDTIKIDVDKIKIVIGKGGETIDKIIAETGVKIDIDEDGLVAIFSPDCVGNPAHKRNHRWSCP